MKKRIIFIFLIILFFLLGISAKIIYDLTFNNSDITDLDIPNSDANNKSELDKHFVSYNGWLHTYNSSILNEHNEPVQLKGLSSHGIQWFSDVITYDNLKILKNDWNTNIFRIAMYTDPNSSGYISNSDTLKQKVYKIVDLAIDLDMYVIIDWHILYDNNPQYYQEEAKIFFDEISKKYSNTPNVIYEICNEPNGESVTWENNIKPYSEQIIPVIRKNCPNSLIIVGTPDWSKDLNAVCDNPLQFENVAYAFHFYSGSHNISLSKTIDNCMNKGISVFVSECGLTDASGDGNLYFEEFNAWIEYLDLNNISWIYWSFSNKAESSAIIRSDYVPFVVQNFTDEHNLSLEDNNLTDEHNSSLEDNNLTNNHDSSLEDNNLTDEHYSSLEDNNLTVTYFNFSEYLTPAGQFVYDLLQ